MEEAHLYMEFGVSPVPGDSSTSLYFIAQGLSNEPTNLSDAERRDAYRQADTLSGHFAARMGLPKAHCFE